MEARTQQRCRDFQHAIPILASIESRDWHRMLRSESDSHRARLKNGSARSGNLTANHQGSRTGGFEFGVSGSSAVSPPQSGMVRSSVAQIRAEHVLRRWHRASHISETLAGEGEHVSRGPTTVTAPRDQADDTEDVPPKRCNFNRG